MSHSFASLIGALVATTTLAWSGAAFAEIRGVDLAALGSGYTASDAPLGVPTELRIDLKGRVAARCELLSPPAPMGKLALTRPGASQAAFAIDCNTPFLLRVRSGKGGFANPAPTPGITPLLPYQLSVAVGTDAGRQDLGWCDAAALTDIAAGSCVYAPTSASNGWSSGDATAIRQAGTVKLRWSDAPSEAPLLGDYSDIIVIELEVRS